MGKIADIRNKSGSEIIRMMAVVRLGATRIDQTPVIGCVPKGAQTEGEFALMRRLRGIDGLSLNVINAPYPQRERQRALIHRRVCGLSLNLGFGHKRGLNPDLSPAFDPCRRPNPGQPLSGLNLNRVLAGRTHRPGLGHSLRGKGIRRNPGLIHLTRAWTCSRMDMETRSWSALRETARVRTV